MFGHRCLLLLRTEATKKCDLFLNSKLVQSIVGYDAASLYLWCVGQEMPCGVLHDDPRDLSDETVLDEVRQGTFFDFVQIDIHVPDHLVDYFSEMPPIFKNVAIPFDSMGTFSQTHYPKPDQACQHRRRR